MTNTQTAIYLFCISLAADLPEVHGVGFDDAQSLFTIQHNELTAIGCEVPIQDFVGAEAEARLQDIQWIAPRALHHEAVVEQVMKDAPALPARFGTLYSERASLIDFLNKQHDSIAQFLNHIKGKQEFAVKGMLNRNAARQRLLEQNLSEQQVQLASLSPGQRYFKEQKIKAAVEQELNQWLQQICSHIAQQLNQIAIDFRARNVSKGDGEMEMILNWALLIPAESEAELRLRVDAINAAQSDAGLFFTLSGPWPPYSFAPILTMEQNA